MTGEGGTGNECGARLKILFEPLAAQGQEAEQVKPFTMPGRGGRTHQQ